MQGLHLTAELHDCVAAAPGCADLMRDAAALREHCLSQVHASGLKAVGDVFHPFAPPGGVTGVVLLAESHMAVHTWPEQSAVTLDVYVCNVSADNTVAAERLMATLTTAFAPARTTLQRWARGGPLPTHHPDLATVPLSAHHPADRPSNDATPTPAAWPNAKASSNTE